MIKVYVCESDFGLQLDIAIVKEMNGKRYIAKPVEFIFEEVDVGGVMEPTIRLQRDLRDELLKTLAEALDKQGVKTENDFKIQGLLEATKFHLGDMRRLVFKTE